MPMGMFGESRLSTDNDMFGTTLTDSKPGAGSYRQLRSAVRWRLLSLSRFAFRLWVSMALIQACTLWMNVKAQ